MRKANLKKLTIFGIIILGWIFLSLIFIYSKTNITVISKNENNNVISNIKYTELLKNEKITGRFIASENYLGQISVRFYNYDRINKDEVIFRLFNSGSLIYEHIYKTDQFLPNGLFPFGFTTISDSKGKEYNFEVISVAGRLEDAVALSQESPLVATSYQYPKQLLIKNPSLAIQFISKKISYINFNNSFFFSCIEYFMFVGLSLFLVYLFLINLSKIKQIRGMITEVVIVSGLLLISVSAVIYSFKLYALSEKISIYGYFILIIGTFISLLKKARNKL